MIYTKTYLSTKGIQWMHKFFIKKLPTGERVHKRDHFHDKRCTSCWYFKEDGNHLFQCAKRRSLRKKVLNQINLLEDTVDPRLCDIMREGLLTCTLMENQYQLQCYKLEDNQTWKGTTY